jgi:hypothetical protein
MLEEWISLGVWGSWTSGFRERAFHHKESSFIFRRSNTVFIYLSAKSYNYGTSAKRITSYIKLK